MGGTRSRVVADTEMQDVSEFKSHSTKRKPQMYPPCLDDICVLTGKTDLSGGFKRHSYVMKPEGDGQTRAIIKADSMSSDSGSLSSHEFSHCSQGVDALAMLNKSPSHLQSTPKNNGNQGCKFSIGGGFDVPCNGNHGDGETIETVTPDVKYCNCDPTNNSSCEVIITTHESVVSKKMLGPKTLRRSCSMCDDILLLQARQKPKWKIEVEMESTRVIHGALQERDPNDSFVSDTTSSGDTKIYTRDESTETDGFENLCESDGEDSDGQQDEHLTMTSSDSMVDDHKKKKTFWAKKKNRKHSVDKEKSQNIPSANGGTLKQKHFWSFAKGSTSSNHVLSNPKPNLRLRESTFEEKLKYLHIAARVCCPRAADVRATLLVETPSVKLTNAQLSTKTYLLSVTLNAFFYPYPKIYVEWVESLSDIVQERMTVGDITQKFVTSDVSTCKVCLILSPDASVLLCKPNCTLICDLANIAGYSRRSTFVMEATGDRKQMHSNLTSDSTMSSLAPISETCSPIYEVDEFDDEVLNINWNRNGANTL